MAIINKYWKERVENASGPDYFVVMGPGIGGAWTSPIYSDSEKEIDFIVECMEFARLKTLELKIAEPVA